MPSEKEGEREVILLGTLKILVRPAPKRITGGGKRKKGHALFGIGDREGP